MQTLYRVIVLYLCVLVPAFAQSDSPVVTTQPAFPTADAEVTLIFDLKQAKDSRAKALLGKTDDVYLWSGAGSTETGNAFAFQPVGQTDFSKPFLPGRMTSLGNDRWQIKLVPRSYFGVPAGTPIRKLGLLLKSGDGRAQTEDLIITIYDDRFNLSRLEPLQKNFYVDPNSALLVRYRTSKRATFALTLDGQPVATVTDSDSLRATLNAGTQPGTRRTVILTATAPATGETAADTFFFTVKPQPAIADLPAGVQDGINYTASNRGQGRATLALYAPKKSFVYLLGDFNNWTISPDYLMNRTPDGNRYWIDLPNLTLGQEIAFQYLVDGTIPIADPYAEKILDRSNDRFIPATTYPNLKAFPQNAQGNTVSILQPGQTPFTFKTTGFQRPAVNTMVVYELLVRDFVQNRSYQTLTDSLVYLKQLGINTIELMPVTEFTGNDSWGYNPIFYFAPDKAYGPKDALKRFIDAAHGQGIAVVLDMVLNQADYEFPYVKLYWNGDRPSADSPYFNQQATHPFSVFFDFNHESPDTKAFVDRVCRFWLQEYNVDGFRFDLSKGFTQKQTGGDVAAWGNYDASRVAIWKRIYDQIRRVDPTAYVILEHFADNQEEKELADYGMLLWGNHNGDFRGAIRSAQGNFEGISYQKRGFQRPSLVGYLESHDEERLVYDLRQNGLTEGNYSIKSLPTALDRAKLAAAFLLTVPGPKMIWQFGELGYDLSINTCSDGTTIRDDCRTAAKPVRWEDYQNPDRQKLYKVYSELIKLKTTVPAFATTDFTTDFANPVKRLTLRSASGTVFLIGNFDTRPQIINAGFPSAGKWFHFFSGQEVQVNDVSQSVTLEPGAFHLYSTSKLPTPEAGLVPFSVVPGQVTAVAEDALDQITLSPNPVDDQVMVEVASGFRGMVELSLRDTGGRLIRTARSSKNSDRLRQPIDLHLFPSGVYFLRVQQGERQRTMKVLKR
ncbi:T9SS type A sorting domain-containing protein [Spirosoma taeanense]|uniref:T9SS type A sorting domain-containing protein n=1 Tax=Spirosoma taeanense TaxID=2735870 RepID=A0A6M5Y5T7_9BACT|nr:alpha-amylase family glycosyl hydrolase [Spirosoma taeanense]QJW88730.1 T9SS type A sorting domain-containing protein [Spirosoma taeanense]